MRMWRCAAALAMFGVGGTALAETDYLRIANWNVNNRPNGSADFDDLVTGLNFAGTLDPAGIGARPFDLLALAETDTNSIGPTVDALTSAYGGNYASVVSSFDNAGDRTGFVYDTDRLTLLDVTELSGGPFAHNLTRATFRPADTDGEVDFTAYAIHFKSDVNPAQTQQRLDEARAVAADARSLGGDANVLYLGDFNWVGADERGPGQDSAWWTLIRGGETFTEAAAFDPLGYHPRFRDNPDLLAAHSQNPSASMDDRFDAQLFSTELRDGDGLEYVTDSYCVVGNNGTHTLNGHITTGTAGDLAMLEALASFSDHLPVFADYAYPVTNQLTVPEPAVVGVLVLGGLFLRRPTLRA
ncbi:MAG: hypothetical protein AAGD32_12830 [Planctomycetota bacterium]